MSGSDSQGERACMRWGEAVSCCAYDGLANQMEASLQPSVSLSPFHITSSSITDVVPIFRIEAAVESYYEP